MGASNNLPLESKWIIHYGTKDPTFANSVENTYHMPVTRCDTIVTKSVGCLLPWVPAYLDVTRTKPGVDVSSYSDHVLSAVGSGLPGGYGTDTYLHRLQSVTAQNRNRATACASAAVRATNPSTPAQTYQCNEYPFASTQEGAATSPTPGPARSFPGCNMRDPVRSGPTGFSRCWIKKQGNELGGTYFGVFLQSQRLIDPSTSNTTLSSAVTDRFEVGRS